MCRLTMRRWQQRDGPHGPQHPSGPSSFFSSADSDFTDLDRGQPHGYGNSLAFLPANAHALIQLQVIPNHCHFAKNHWAISNERRTFHRKSDPAIFDEIRFAGTEYKFSARDIHLSATKVDGIESLFHGT